jgi:hypothetical protein
MSAADFTSQEVAAEASPKRFSMMAIKTVVATQQRHIEPVHGFSQRIL